MSETDLSTTAFSWLLLIIQWNCCSCALVQHWITLARTNHCTEHFHLPFAHSCLKKIYMRGIHNFASVNWQCLQLQIQILIPADERIQENVVSKKLWFFSEFISCALRAYGVRCLNCSSKISVVNKVYVVMSISKCNETLYSCKYSSC